MIFVFFLNIINPLFFLIFLFFAIQKEEAAWIIHAISITFYIVFLSFSFGLPSFPYASFWLPTIYLIVDFWGWNTWKQKPLFNRLAIKDDNILDDSNLDNKTSNLKKMSIAELILFFLAGLLFTNSIVMPTDLSLNNISMIAGSLELLGFSFMIKHWKISWIFLGVSALSNLIFRSFIIVYNPLAFENFIYISSVVLCIYGFINHQKHYNSK